MHPGVGISSLSFSMELWGSTGWNWHRGMGSLQEKRWQFPDEELEMRQQLPVQLQPSVSSRKSLKIVKKAISNENTNPLTNFPYYSHWILFQNWRVWKECQGSLCFPSLWGCFWGFGGVFYFWLSAASCLHSEQKKIFNSCIYLSKFQDFFFLPQCE